MEFKDYYAVLGVTPQTPVDEIKRAYRKLARQYHPDVSKLPDAEKRFKEINEAWEVIQDPEKKAQYDQLRAGGWSKAAQGFRQPQTDYYSGDHPEDYASFGQEGDFSEFFNSFFGGRQAAQGGRHRTFKMKGQDIHAKIRVPLTLAYHGGTQTIQLQTSEGTAPKSLKVKIPAGVTQGSQIRLKGQGGAGIGGGTSGDLYVEIELEHHPYFTVHHQDIHLNLPVTPWEAALGATLAVPTLGGNVNLKIPPFTQSGHKMRLKGRGLPGSPLGDQYVILQITTPRAESAEAKALYQEMAKVMAFNPREKLGV